MVKEIKVPGLVADVPFVRGASRYKRQTNNHMVENFLSPISYKIFLLGLNKGEVSSLDVKNLAKYYPAMRLKRAAKEINQLLVNKGSIAQASTLPFGRWRRIKVKLLKNCGETYIKIPYNLFRKTRNTTHLDILALLLWSRYQNIHYKNFLTEFILGATLDILDSADNKVCQRITNTYKNFHYSLKYMGFKYEYEETRIAVGKYTAPWFNYIEFKK